MSQDDPGVVGRPTPPQGALTAAQRPTTAKPPAPTPVQHVERLPLVVPVRDFDNPDGVNLKDVLAAAQSVASAVSDLAVLGRTLTVFSDRPLESAERSELAALLADSTRLARLARPKVAATTAADPIQLLLDETTDDQTWLRAFRRYAVTHLIPREGKQE
ncbi:hypothetical protein ACN27J_16755 [Solwaraspora sp. WMMB762]|uniref:hypothetical protein n=1 Tax=Solwaraspora sp. WMMB762 TaxID=3404120 RepID=UPI003B92C2D1